MHHVTATVNDAQEDYDFYTKLLGMRLVKETVNFDNEKVYHFYYGNELGTPSTIFTTFPYKGQGVRQGVIGTGQVHTTYLSIPIGSVNFWRSRLEGYGISFEEINLFGNPSLLFDDPSGLHLGLVESEDHREPIWSTEAINKDQSVRGIFGVLLLVEDESVTLDFLTEFGYTVLESSNGNHLLSAGEGKPGDFLVLKEDKSSVRGVNGIGTVHHVAHRVSDVEKSIQIKTFAENRGLKVTELKDRKYFKSIYFRIPGGILFEVATEEPGFDVDETRENLGTELKLPDWQEPNRERIEANLLPYNR